MQVSQRAHDERDTDYSRVPASALIALAGLVMKRARIRSILAIDKASAIAIIRGITVKPRLPKAKINAACVCRKCGQPIPKGSLCTSEYNSDICEHIHCPIGGAYL